MVLSLGDDAPAFSLSDCEGNTYSLASFKGKKIYLAFLRCQFFDLCIALQSVSAALVASTS